MPTNKPLPHTVYRDTFAGKTLVAAFADRADAEAFVAAEARRQRYTISRDGLTPIPVGLSEFPETSWTD